MTLFHFTFDFLRSISSLFDKNDSCKTGIQIPQIYWWYPAFEIQFPILKYRKNRTLIKHRIVIVMFIRQGILMITKKFLNPKLHTWSKAAFASTSSFRSLSDGIAPSSSGGSYELVHGDLKICLRRKNLWAFRNL